MSDEGSPVPGDSRGLWLAGGGGLHWSRDGKSWTQNEEYRFRVTSIARAGGRICVGANTGLWGVAEDSSQWTQIHDETVTEVLDLGVIPGDPGVVVASAYGVAVGARDERGAVRWTERTAGLAVNERYTNAIAVDPDDNARWLVGTEAGLLVSENQGETWTHSGLMGVSVGAILRGLGAWWAGTAGRGIWRSQDGLSWRRAGRGLDEGTVYALAESDGRVVAGTLEGAALGDGEGQWVRSGPRAMVGAVGVDPGEPSHWLIGAVPGGLWVTSDSGARWRNVPGLPASIEAIVAPERRAE